jgi:glycosyltransferase involved in cell wall biosynthesis
MSRHVTVALCAHNARPFIRQALWSILHQSHRELDVYVVDDGSGDGTADEVRDLVRADRRAHLVRLRESIGTYAAKNLVLATFCRGEYFAHQDADDRSREHRLARQIEFLERNPDVPLCGTSIDEFFASQADAPAILADAEIRYSEASGHYHRENVYAARISRTATIPPIGELSRIKIAMNGSLVIRADFLKRLGGYDGRTRMAGDTELLWRVLCLRDVANLQEVLYERRFHGASLTRSAAYGFESEARREYAGAVRERILRALRESPEAADLERALRQDMYFPSVCNEYFE